MAEWQWRTFCCPRWLGKLRLLTSSDIESILQQLDPTTRIPSSSPLCLAREVSAYSDFSTCSGNRKTFATAGRWYLQQNQMDCTMCKVSEKNLLYIILQHTYIVIRLKIFLIHQKMICWYIDTDGWTKSPTLHLKNLSAPCFSNILCASPRRCPQCVGPEGTFDYYED